jgi:hypothetical protein|tara:strand:- start:1085 stop:1531 length:447 start_codon:yes stop_codon:yes gene_type:complete
MPTIQPIIKSFKGLMTDGQTDTILLHRKDGSTGYRIKKFMLMPAAPGTDNMESIIKIYKISPGTPTIVLDFNDNTLLGAGYIESHAGEESPTTSTIFFDGEYFNDDIYVTLKDTLATDGVNYYIELEQVELDMNANTVATLKGIRNNA